MDISISMGHNLQADFAVYVSIFVTVLLSALVISFFIKCRKIDVLILKVLIFLLINEIAFMVFELVGTIDKNLCQISMIGMVFFLVAANFWIVFITRLLYIEATAPGKCLNLIKMALKNIIFTYTPSFVFGAFLLVVLFADGAENRCQNTQNMDTIGYIIYISCFMVPSGLSVILTIFYFLRLMLSPMKKPSIFWGYPGSSIIFSGFYLGIRGYQFWGKGTKNIDLLDLVLLIQPLFYGILFVLIYCKVRKSRKKTTGSDLTIRGSDAESSFIDSL